LKIAPGRAYEYLKQGKPQANTDGLLVEPSWVIGANKPGRRIALLGQPAPGSALERCARNAGENVYCNVLGSFVGLRRQSAA
jgi:hypothetical protein